MSARSFVICATPDGMNRYYPHTKTHFIRYFNITYISFKASLSDSGGKLLLIEAAALALLDGVDDNDGAMETARIQRISLK